MNIFDLNHIETVEGTEIVGGHDKGGKGGRGFDFFKYIDINEYVEIYVDKYFFSEANIKDNAADAEAIAEGAGANTLSETLTYSFADVNGSNAASGSKSAYSV